MHVPILVCTTATISSQIQYWGGKEILIIHAERMTLQTQHLSECRIEVKKWHLRMARIRCYYLQNNRHKLWHKVSYLHSRRTHGAKNTFTTHPYIHAHVNWHVFMRFFPTDPHTSGCTCKRTDMYTSVRARIYTPINMHTHAHIRLSMGAYVHEASRDCIHKFIQASQVMNAYL